MNLETVSEGLNVRRLRSGGDERTTKNNRPRRKLDPSFVVAKLNTVMANRSRGRNVIVPIPGEPLERYLGPINIDF